MRHLAEDATPLTSVKESALPGRSSIRQGESFVKEDREAWDELKNWGIVRLSGISREPTQIDEDMMAVAREPW